MTDTLDDYPYTVAIEVRLRDVDFMGHVNNAVYATYLEQARDALFRAAIGTPLDELDTVLASLTIDYERPIHADDSVTIGVDVPELGDSSVPMRYAIVADDRRAATATTVQVFVDRSDGTSSPVPEDVRAGIRSLCGRE